MKLLLACFTVSAIFSVMVNSAEAKSYTKSELKKMVAGKKYPKTKNPQESTHSFDFDACKTVAYGDRVEKDEEGYPTQVVTEKANLVVIKTWQSHMTTTSTCKEGSGVIKNIDYDYAD